MPMRSAQSLSGHHSAASPQHAAGCNIEQPPDLAIPHLTDPSVVAQLARAVLRGVKPKCAPTSREREKRQVRLAIRGHRRRGRS
jgi:hypothetical protein